jgi:acyl-CoA synthetase (NDP forming)
MVRKSAGLDEADAFVIASALDNPGAVNMASITADALATVDKFAMAVWNAGSDEVRDQYQRIGVPYFDDPRTGFRSLVKVIEANSVSDQRLLRVARAAGASAQEHGHGVGPEGRRVLTEHEIGKSLRSHGVAMASSVLAQSLGDAAEAASELGYPLVLKAISPDIPHRARVGALSTGIATVAELEREYRRIEEVVRGLKVSGFEGILVQAQIASRQEIFFGVRLVAGLGAVAAIGAGGTDVETKRAFAFALVPFVREDVDDCVARATGLGASLDSDERARLADLLLAIQDWWMKNEVALDLVELDVNPIILDDQGRLHVADALGVGG